MYTLEKGRLGYSYSNDEKYYKNFFVKASTSLNNLVYYNYCGNKGHISSSCYIKKKNLKKGTYISIQKGTRKPHFIKSSKKKTHHDLGI